MSLAQREPLQHPATVQNGTPLSRVQQRAARLLAEDDKTDAEICAAVKIKSRTTLSRWKLIPAFDAMVQEVKAEIKARILEETKYADKVYRVRDLGEMAVMLRDQLMATQMKRYETVFSREGNPIVDENGDVYRDEYFDKDKFAAFRGTLKDMANELGDLPDTTQPVDVRVGLQIVYHRPDGSA